MFSKILCPVDLSENSVKALQWTEYIARKHNSNVVILHVIESLQANPMMDVDYPQIQASAAATLREFVTPLTIPYESMLSSGHAANKIVALAEAINAGMIVMGTRGLHGVSHTILGSNTERVVRTSHLPVLTVTPGCTLPSESSDARVLVPIPSLQHAPRGYLRLRRILKQMHAVPSLLHVARGSESNLVYSGAPRGETTTSLEITDLKRNLLRVGTRITNYTDKVNATIRIGNVADEILKELQSGSYDYLLMSVRNRGILPTFVESIAYHILSRAPVPVVTVKKGE